MVSLQLFGYYQGKGISFSLFFLFLSLLLLFPFLFLFPFTLFLLFLLLFSLFSSNDSSRAAMACWIPLIIHLHVHCPILLISLWILVNSLIMFLVSHSSFFLFVVSFFHFSFTFLFLLSFFSVIKVCFKKVIIGKMKVTGGTSFKPLQSNMVWTPLILVIGTLFLKIILLPPKYVHFLLLLSL